MSAWGLADAVAHLLYCPTMCGRCWGVTRWHHRIHLIPAPWLRYVCERYDREFT